MMRWITVSVLAVSFTFSNVAFSEESKNSGESACETWLGEAPIPGARELLSENLLNNPELVFSNYEKNQKDGIGGRGFMGAGMPNTPENAEVALKYGMVYWGLKLNIVPNVESAIEHRLKVRAYLISQNSVLSDPAAVSVYILGDEKELGLTFAGEGKESRELTVDPQIVSRLLARGGYKVSETGEATFIPAEQMQRRIGTAGLVYHNQTAFPEVFPAAFGYNALTQSGWVALSPHGIHDYSTFKDRDSAKKLKKLAAKLIERGYTIRFNQDYKWALDLLKVQRRSHRVDGERKEYDVVLNRYQDETLYNTALARLQGGRGYMVGVYSPSGQLLAGEIGFRNGNHLYGDSVYYPPEEEYSRAEHGFNSIDLAKVGTLALLEVMYDAGMPYTDPGMISKYTASLGAENMSFQEYRQKILSGPIEPIELPALWDPLPADYLQKKFEELAKKRNQALGNVMALSRLPLENKQSVEVANSYNINRVRLRLSFVSNPQEASEVAAQSLDYESLPVFVVVGSELKPNVDESAMDYLRRLRQSMVKLEVLFVKNSKYPESFKELDWKRLIEFLDLDLEGQDLIWENPANSTVPTIAVPAWGLKN